ncbi:MAG: 5'-nucleotidase C-terminal domain-containing protein [Deltaproteobacteria bacterium]|nr:5'-nucleotidase C-terminal domain-containing protein [Deltaproteobacteria bacterium]
MEHHKTKLTKVLALVMIVMVAMAMLAAATWSSGSEGGSSELKVTIAHINDTHSQLDPTEQSFTLNNAAIRVSIGGVTRIKTAMDNLRKTHEHVLFLHAGDTIQGTPYFTRFQGAADIDFDNLLGIDAMCLGNHEFDRGPALTAKLISQAKFPVLSANIDASGEPLLKDKIQPYTIKNFGAHQIGIIGVTTPDTVNISSPGPNLKFNDAAQSVTAAVSKLNSLGVNIIIVLSHLGYHEDIQLAAKITGVGVIIGGHSHTLLGDPNNFKSAGVVLTPSGDYPTVVKNPAGKNVYIAQAWSWYNILGQLDVVFDADGDVQSCVGHPTLIVSEVIKQKDASGKYVAVQAGSPLYQTVVQSLPAAAQVLTGNAEAEAKLAVYRKAIEPMMQAKIAYAANDLKRGDNVGPGPIVADSMLWKTKSLGTQIAMQNAGGIRADILSGDVTVGTVSTVLPFRNTLVVIELAGRDVVKSLEDGVAFQLKHNPPRHPPYIYVSGVSFTVTRANPAGSRVGNVKVKDPTGAYTAIDPAKKYRVVVNNYMADGKDDYYTFKNATGYKYDTGFGDAEVFMDYLTQVLNGTISNPTTALITVTRAQVIDIFNYLASAVEPARPQVNPKTKKAA